MPGQAALQVVLVFDKMDTEGVAKFAKQIADSLPAIGRETGHRIAPVKMLDGREPPCICDICIHIHVPYAVWFPWARTNVMLVNPSTWKQSWSPYLDSIDVFGFPDEASKESMLDSKGPQPRHSMVVSFDQKTTVGDMISECVNAFEVREPLPKHMPPILHAQDCPPISVVTLTYNRPKFIENACLNLLSTDYPRDKIEWIVVDDSDPDKSPSDRILQFAEKFAPGIVTYVPLVKKKSIGFKRNLAIERAKHNVIVMMDDDDHYPSTSFRRRVAYLLKGRRQFECAACTTIAMYDLRNGTSAVNVPPYTLSLSERISEASMVFTRGFWNRRKFEDVSMAEGESFIKGREDQVIEMPPQQMIVALNHGQNISSRAMPDAKPSCFWGFSRPHLEFLHGLIGIKVEAA